MKALKKILCAVLCVLMVFTSMVFATAEEETTDEVAGFTQEDFLTTKGRKLVNQKGEKVQLKGVNLGAWLVREDWLNPDHIGVTDAEYAKMSPADQAIYDEYKGKIYDGEMIYDVLEKRFGREKAQELLNLFYDGWITEWDLDNIKAMGFNCVRVPFWYRNFYYDDKGTKILDENGEWDFSRLDWVVEEC